jgi:hypothetical protein
MLFWLFSEVHPSQGKTLAGSNRKPCLRLINTRTSHKIVPQLRRLGFQAMPPLRVSFPAPWASSEARCCACCCGAAGVVSGPLGRPSLVQASLVGVVSGGTARRAYRRGGQVGKAARRRPYRSPTIVGGNSTRGRDESKQRACWEVGSPSETNNVTWAEFRRLSGPGSQEGGQRAVTK